MIPYDDLVSALAGWRARQGLPVAQPAGAPPAPPPRAPAPPQPAARTTGTQPAARTTGTQPAARTTGTQPAARPGPPSAPPQPQARTAPPPPQAPYGHNDFEEAEDALIAAGGYDAGGDDFAMAFGNTVEQSGEATAIGSAPEPASDAASSAKRGKRPPEW
jgi:hypothetical protein